MVRSSERVDAIYRLVPDVMDKTQALLRKSSAQGAEAYCVWVGELRQGAARVRDVWPVAAAANAAHARVSLDHVLLLGDRVARRGWFILAQLHTHPGDAFHSAVDDRFPISNQPGFVSIVVPNFGKDHVGQGWAWFVLDGAGRWHHLTGKDIAAQFVPERPSRRSRIWNAITGLLRS